MGRLLRIVPGAILALALASCAGTINRNMQSWVGHPADELIARIGPPTAVFRSPWVEGAFVMVYASDVDLGGHPAYSTTSGTLTGTGWGAVQVQAVTVYQPAERYGWQRYREFRVDRDGVIQGWRWQGM
jgi:hypothetical protein